MRPHLLVVLASLAACSPEGEPDPAPAPGCSGGAGAMLFEGNATISSAVGGTGVDTCVMNPGGCPNGSPGSCATLTVSGDNGIHTLIATATTPLASGSFSCDSESVAVGLSKFGEQSVALFNGVAGRSGDETIGSCTVAIQTLDDRHWIGQIEATVEDKLQGTSSSLQVTANLVGQ